MPKRQPEHMKAQRDRILRATLDAIGEHGIERTSIVEIRRAAGLSAGALYTHFTNKDAIVAAALSYVSVKEAVLPSTWPEFVAGVASTADEGGFDIATIARLQLQVFASAIRPGPLHDLLRPIIQAALDTIAGHLHEMARAGEITLRMSPVQTALAMGAVKDGLMWTGLALDRPLADVEADIVAAITCLVGSAHA